LGDIPELAPARASPHGWWRWLLTLFLAAGDIPERWSGERGG